MAFTLKVGKPFQARPRPDLPTAALVQEARQTLLSQRARRFGEFPAYTAAMGVAVFVLGFSAATLRLDRLDRGREALDMTPTGSIAAQAPLPANKSHACQ